ncbi:hypothetical protein LB504_009030 [Fusarium proliferatum]|nr:hypothetical protein LB504_009030 [Fusarium proliferatum]
MSRSIVLFTVGFSLAALVTSQISSIVSSETCGYIDGGRVVITACKPSTNGRPCPDFDRAIECTSRSCGFLFIWGHDNAYAGCCGYERCAIATTCIESGTALNSNTIQCTDGSLSACATYTWPQLSAEAYFCATARTTVTVVTEIRDASSSNPLTFTAEPTIEPSRTDGGGPQPTDAGGPNLGTESGQLELATKDRRRGGLGACWWADVDIFCNLWVLQTTQKEESEATGRFETHATETCSSGSQVSSLETRTGWQWPPY